MRTSTRVMRTLGLLLGTLAFTSTAQADSALDQARRQSDLARRQYETANQQAANAAQTADREKRKLEELNRRKRELPSQIDAANRRAQDAAKRASAADQELPALRAKSTEQANQAAKLRVPEEEAKKAWVGAANGVEQVKADARSAFQVTAPWQQALAALAAAENSLATATDAVVARLLKTPSYAALASAADAAEAKLKKFREIDPSHDQIPGASRAWIEAKNQVSTAKQTALDADPAIGQARQAVAKAKAEQAKLSNQFDATLATLPAVQSAQAMVTERKQGYDAAAALARKAAADADAAKTRLASATRTANEAKASAKSAEEESARLSQEFNGLSREVADAERRKRDAEADEQRLIRARNDARQRLDQALAIEDQARRADQVKKPAGKK